MKKLTTLFLAILAIALVSVSCKKKCTLDDNDTTSGVVITHAGSTEDPNTLVIIFPSSGQMSSSFGGDYIVDANHNYASNFEVSWDGGLTKAPVDYSLYTILAKPIGIKCNARINRDVVVDNLNGIVTYTVTVKDCDEGCDETRTLENYVLVPAFPSNYTLITVVK